MNYLNRISQLGASGALPTPKGLVSHVTVSHDSWCHALKGGACNCNPTIEKGAPNRAQRRAVNKGKR